MRTDRVRFEQRKKASRDADAGARREGGGVRFVWRGGRLPWAGAVVAALAACAGAASGAEAGDWPTYRGNPQRTGCLDGSDGPKRPQVLWVYRAREHFIASPVPGRGVLYISGLGAFNTPLVHCLSRRRASGGAALWTKTTPYVTQPTVCAPAVVDGMCIFGDGMHQTDGAHLYCIRADSGRALWRYPLPGKLVHLEGAPTVADGRVFIGGGDAGVICVALRRVLLDGKEQDLAAVDALLARRWAELVAQYEAERKKDPEFAVPPSDERLPQAAPKLFWQKGKGAWHVDAPLLVHGERVVAASAFLDLEQCGRRSLLCLHVRDGRTLWEAPLKINPWAGPALADDLVLVGCSSIRYDRQLIPKARGEVVAVELATGKVRWRKDVPGGVLSSVAVADGRAFFAATDGRLRAWDAGTGRALWTHDCAHAFFAGCAVAGETLYAADLNGVVYALRCKDGAEQWRVDLSRHPAVQLPGGVFGSPVVQEGALYVATCNLGGPTAEQPCAVVCLSDEAAAAKTISAEIAVDKFERTVTVPCRIAPRKLATLKDVYPLEVVATYPAPRGQKAHETILTFEAKPSDVHRAMVSLGLKPGRPCRGEGPPPAGPVVTLSLLVPSPSGKTRRVAIEQAMVDRRTGRPMPRLRWYFTGSVMRQPDPDKDEKVYGADLGGTLISIFPVTDETVFQSHLSMAADALLELETNPNVLPEEGTAVKLVIRVRPKGWFGARVPKPGGRDE